MKKLYIFSGLFIVIYFTINLTGAPVLLSATTPSLGTAATFGILASTYTNSGATTINGDLGYTTGPGVPPTVNGTTHVADGAYNQAGTDQGSALSNLNSQPCDFNFGSATDLSSLPQPLAPGVYCITGNASIGTASGITLSGVGTYIFRINGALNTVANSVVAGGASACNVFWTPTAATTLGANSTFLGTIIDASGIAIGNAITWTGRALAFGGTITSVSDTITVPTCTASASGFSSVTYSKTVPLISILKVPSPLVLPAGSSTVTYNYTVRNVGGGGQQPIADVTVTDDKCRPVIFSGGDINNDGKLDAGENWKYFCTDIIGTTTTNISTARGYSDDNFHIAATAMAMATVVVTNPLAQIIPLPAPLISVTKVPSQLTPFSFGGGNVSYNYSVTNPGVVPLNNVLVTDDKCAPVSFLSGDTNDDDLLNPSETWTYICRTHISITTNNIVTAEGSANGFTALAQASATVLVSSPSLPKTGFSPLEQKEKLTQTNPPLSLIGNNKTSNPRVTGHLIIPKINVNADIESVSTTLTGAIDVPRDSAHAGWFDQSSYPGEMGTAIIDGHSSWKNGKAAVFETLYTLHTGDKIYIEDEKGAAISFVVRELRSYGAKEDTSAIFASSGKKSSLILITCSGAWDKIAKTSSDRLVIFADKE